MVRTRGASEAEVGEWNRRTMEIERGRSPQPATSVDYGTEADVLLQVVLSLPPSLSLPLSFPPPLLPIHNMSPLPSPTYPPPLPQSHASLHTMALSHFDLTHPRYPERLVPARSTSS
jgi:hypothetical protein